MDSSKNLYCCCKKGCRDVKICGKCEPFCSGKFRQALKMENSNLILYTHLTEDVMELNKLNPFESISFIVYNPTRTTARRADYMKDFDIYRPKCYWCNILMMGYRKVLEELQCIKNNQIIGICESCRAKGTAMDCHRCLYLKNKFVSSTISKIKTIAQLKEDWLQYIKLKNITKVIDKDIEITYDTLLQKSVNINEPIITSLLSLETKKATLEDFFTREDLEKLLGREYINDLPKTFFISLDKPNKDKLINVFGFNITNDIVERALLSLQREEKPCRCYDLSYGETIIDYALQKLRNRIIQGTAIFNSEDILDPFINLLCQKLKDRDDLESSMGSGFTKTFLNKIIATLMEYPTEKVLQETPELSQTFASKISYLLRGRKLNIETLDKLLGRDMANKIISKILRKIKDLNFNKFSNPSVNEIQETSSEKFSLKLLPPLKGISEKCQFYKNEKKGTEKITTQLSKTNNVEISHPINAANNKISIFGRNYPFKSQKYTRVLNDTVIKKTLPLKEVKNNFETKKETSFVSSVKKKQSESNISALSHTKSQQNTIHAENNDLKDKVPKKTLPLGVSKKKEEKKFELGSLVNKKQSASNISALGHNKPQESTINAENNELKDKVPKKTLPLGVSKKKGENKIELGSLVNKKQSASNIAALGHNKPEQNTIYAENNELKDKVPKKTLPLGVSKNKEENEIELRSLVYKQQSASYISVLGHTKSQESTIHAENNELKDKVPKKTIPLGVSKNKEENKIELGSLVNKQQSASNISALSHTKSQENIHAENNELKDKVPKKTIPLGVSKNKEENKIELGSLVNKQQSASNISVLGHTKSQESTIHAENNELKDQVPKKTIPLGVSKNKEENNIELGSLVNKQQSASNISALSHTKSQENIHAENNELKDKVPKKTLPLGVSKNKEENKIELGSLVNKQQIASNISVLGHTKSQESTIHAENNELKDQVPKKTLPLGVSKNKGENKIELGSLVNKKQIASNISALGHTKSQESTIHAENNELKDQLPKKTLPLGVSKNKGENKIELGSLVNKQQSASNISVLGQTKSQENIHAENNELKDKVPKKTIPLGVSKNKEENKIELGSLVNKQQSASNISVLGQTKSQESTIYAENNELKDKVPKKTLPLGVSKTKEENEIELRSLVYKQQSASNISALGHTQSKQKISLNQKKQESNKERPSLQIATPKYSKKNMTTAEGDTKTSTGSDKHEIKYEGSSSEINDPKNLKKDAVLKDKVTKNALPLGIPKNKQENKHETSPLVNVKQSDSIISSLRHTESQQTLFRNQEKQENYKDKTILQLKTQEDGKEFKTITERKSGENNDLRTSTKGGSRPSRNSVKIGSISLGTSHNEKQKERGNRIKETILNKKSEDSPSFKNDKFPDVKVKFTDKTTQKSIESNVPGNKLFVTSVQGGKLLVDVKSEAFVSPSKARLLLWKKEIEERGINMLMQHLNERAEKKPEKQKEEAYESNLQKNKKFKSPKIVKKPPTTFKSESETGKKSIKVHDDAPGAIRYQLSNPIYIAKGWTQLPSTRFVRKLPLFDVTPTNPERDFFQKQAGEKYLFYNSGQRMAEIDPDNHGRWYYKNGALALDYYKPQEPNMDGRYIIYDSEKRNVNNSSIPTTVLGVFDTLGSGIVYDFAGNERLKYNQHEGAVIDELIGAPGKWKWNNLVKSIQPITVMVESYEELPPDLIVPENKTPPIKRGRITAESAAKQITDIENEALLSEAKKLDRYKPFYIKPKVFKINNNFSLHVIDQSNIYLVFRDAKAVLKQNLGVELNLDRIIGVEEVDTDQVWTPLDRLIPQSDSVRNLRKLIKETSRTHSNNVNKKCCDLDIPKPSNLFS